MNTITRGEAKSQIDYAFAGMPYDAEKIGFAVANDVTVRDYVLGQNVIFTEEYASSVVARLIEATDKSAHPGLYCVLGAWSGTSKTLNEWALKALEIDAEYNLAKLLLRTSVRDDAPEFLNAMAQELHPKVIASLLDTADEVIEA